VRLLTFASPFLCVLCADGAQSKFVWQGQVDGIAILHLQGKKLATQIQEGGPIEREEFHFSEALPDVGQKVRLEVLKGRGLVHVIDQPSAENQYTLAVAIEDRQPGAPQRSSARPGLGGPRRRTPVRCV